MIGNDWRIVCGGAQSATATMRDYYMSRAGQDETLVDWLARVNEELWYGVTPAQADDFFAMAAGLEREALHECASDICWSVEAQAYALCAGSEPGTEAVLSCPHCGRAWTVRFDINGWDVTKEVEQ